MVRNNHLLLIIYESFFILLIGGLYFKIGGHLSRKIDIPEGVEITKVEVSRSSWALDGMKIHLSDGTSDGAISDWQQNEISILGMSCINLSSIMRLAAASRRELTYLFPEPSSGHKIIGFFGRSRWDPGHCCPVHEFGIVTAPRDVELPTAVYKMSELQNTDGGVSFSRPFQIYSYYLSVLMFIWSFFTVPERLELQR